MAVNSVYWRALRLTITTVALEMEKLTSSTACTLPLRVSYLTERPLTSNTLFSEIRPSRMGEFLLGDGNEVTNAAPSLMHAFLAAD